MKLTPKELAIMPAIERAFPVGFWFNGWEAALVANVPQSEARATKRALVGLAAKGYLTMVKRRGRDGSANTYRRTGKLMGLNVCAERCPECLYSPRRIVSNDRAAEVLAQCKKSGKLFKCHKTEDLICRGFYDANKEINSTIRLALANNVLHFTDGAGIPVAIATEP